MQSHGKGSLSAITQVKVSSPEIILIALGQGFHFLETNIRTHAKGESVSRKCRDIMQKVLNSFSAI